MQPAPADATMTWVTGACGFIGRAVVARLAAMPIPHATIGHGRNVGDVGDVGHAMHLDAAITLDALDALAAAHGMPDAVLHLAGGASVGASLAAPLADFERTVAATATLLEWLRRHAPQARLIVASSAAVYGAGHEGPIAEDAAVAPFSPYGHHKAAMELLCRGAAHGHGQPIAVARLFSVYGAGLRKQLLWDMCTRLARGERPLTLGGTGAELRDWTHVDDVARVLVALVDRADAAIPVVNVGTGRGITVSAVAHATVAAWGEATLAFDGRARPGDPFSLIADTRRLSTMGLDCPARTDGIAAYVGWFRSTAA